MAKTDVCVTVGRKRIRYHCVVCDEEYDDSYSGKFVIQDCIECHANTRLGCPNCLEDGEQPNILTIEKTINLHYDDDVYDTTVERLSILVNIDGCSPQYRWIADTNSYHKNENLWNEFSKGNIIDEESTEIFALCKCSECDFKAAVYTYRDS